jgi:ligand-binding SRPBCC domain-containing protein
MVLNKDFSFTIQSPVHGGRNQIWEHITQMKNVNAELMPFAAMTYPPDKAAIAGNHVPLNETLFTSVILLFGFLPVDLHHLAFDAILPGHSFQENSKTLMHRYWKHTRTINEQSNGCLVTDVVHYLPHLPLIGYALLPLYRVIFNHRHKKLRAAF